MNNNTGWYELLFSIFNSKKKRLLSQGSTLLPSAGRVFTFMGSRRLTEDKSELNLF